MKIFLIGFNASGKREVCDKLASLGVRVGKNFRSIEDVPDFIVENPIFKRRFSIVETLQVCKEYFIYPPLILFLLFIKLTNLQKLANK